jgi:hypothetical protein
MARYDGEEAADDGPNHAVAPALVNAPVIFLAPKERTVSSGEIWIAVSCNDANYGGCVVWASNDDAAYEPIGKIHGNATHGVLTAELPAASGLDMAHALAVDIAASRKTLESRDQQTVDVHDSLCYAGGEFLAYRDAVLTGAGLYSLSYLRRGLFGSAPGAAIGAPFVFNTQRLFRYRFNKNLVGKTLWFKFQGFNLFKAGLQNLADVTAYPFSVTADGGVKALLSDLAALKLKSDLDLPINDAVTGDVPKLVMSLLLPGGAYSRLAATLGADAAGDSATLELRTQPGALLKSLANVGAPAYCETTGFTLAGDTQVEFYLVGNNASAHSFIYGIQLN